MSEPASAAESPDKNLEALQSLSWRIKRMAIALMVFEAAAVTAFMLWREHLRFLMD